MPNSWKRTGVAPEGFAIVPPDGEWGWMVLIGCFINSVCYLAFFLIFYMTMNDMKEEFQVDTVTVTLPVTLLNFAAGICAPLASVITTFSSARMCTMLGGILLSVTLILSRTVTNIWQMTAVVSILGGFGSTCLYVPISVILAEYFKDHFVVVMAINYIGHSVTKLAIPPILEYLLREYSWRECMLIFGAVILNSCVGSATFQPSRWHLKLKPLAVNQTYIELKTTDQSDSPNQNNDNHISENEVESFLMTLRRSLSLDLLKNSMFYLTTVTYCLLTAAIMLSSRFLYVFGVEIGLGPIEAAWLLSVSAIGEILGRIIGPLTLKCFSGSVHSVFLVYCAASTVTYAVFALMASPWSLYALTALNDFFFSCAFVMVPGVMRECLGTAKLLPAMGYSEFLLGFSMLALGPFAGWLHDVTGTYISCFLLFVFMTASVTFMWTLRFALHRFHLKAST